MRHAFFRVVAIVSALAVVIGTGCQDGSDTGDGSSDSGTELEDDKQSASAPPGDRPDEDDEPEPPPECDDDQTVCDGACRDLRRDARHCGRCSHACGEDETCEFGRCLSAEYPAAAPGDRHSCVRSTDGSVECWGWSRYGLQDVPDTRFRRVAAGYYNNCGITDDATIECWGSDAHGVSRPPEGEFRQLAMGDYHGCAIATDDTLACWGRDAYTDVPEGRYRDLAVGKDHACAIDRNGGSIDCWGSNRYGQLEDIPDGPFKTLAAGGYETCAIREDGSVTCWNSPREAHRENMERLRADRDEEYRCGGAIPAELLEDPPEGEFRQIAVGRGQACGLKPDATVECWGAPDYRKPEVPSVKIRDFASGTSHFCGTTMNGEIRCWGHDTNGETEVPERGAAD